MTTPSPLELISAMQPFYENNLLHETMRQKGLACKAHFISTMGAEKIGLFFYLEKEGRVIGNMGWVNIGIGGRKAFITNRHVIIMVDEFEKLADDELDAALEAVRLQLLFS